MGIMWGGGEGLNGTGLNSDLEVLHRKKQTMK